MTLKNVNDIMRKIGSDLLMLSSYNKNFENRKTPASIRFGIINVFIFLKL